MFADDLKTEKVPLSHQIIGVGIIPNLILSLVISLIMACYNVFKSCALFRMGVVR